MSEVNDDLTLESLVESLADAGELDAGVEVLEAWKLRSLEPRTLLRLQARLFSIDRQPSVPLEVAFAAWTPSALDALARDGALLEVAIALRLQLRRFPTDTLWQDRLARVETLLSPLAKRGGDPRLEAVDAMVARGVLIDAHAALRSLCSEGPRNPELERRCDLLRALLWEPAHTRPYRAMTGHEARALLLSEGDTNPDGADPMRVEIPVEALHRWTDPHELTTQPAPALPESEVVTERRSNVASEAPLPVSEAPPSVSEAPPPGDGALQVGRRKIVRLG